MALIAVAINYWQLTGNLAALRLQNDALQSQLAKAMLKYVPYTKDEAVTAIRVLHSASNDYSAIISLLIECLGKLNHHQYELAGMGSTDGDLVLHILDCGYPTSMRTSTSNITVAYIVDQNGNLFDAIAYDSDLSTENHWSTVEPFPVGPAELPANFAIRLNRTNKAMANRALDPRFSTHWTKWTVVGGRFVEETGEWSLSNKPRDVNEAAIAP